MSREQKENVFELDEMELREVNPDWGEEEILQQEGIFFLKDLIAPLNIHRPRLMDHITKVETGGKALWEELGARKTWSHWQVRMKVFAPYYQENLRLPYADIPEEWDANTLVNQREGVYLLNDVWAMIPFTIHQIRYQSMKNPSEMGVQKHQRLGRFLVDIAIFGPRLKKTWRMLYE